VALVKRHAGVGLDPKLVEQFCQAAREVLQALETTSVWDAALQMEPGNRRQLVDTLVDVAALFFADFADLKSAFTVEHSRRVADLAAAAAQKCGLGDDDVALIRRAGMVQDVDRVPRAASARDPPHPQRESELELVRLHGYYTERVLRRAEAL
jgi:HD-GYP domain-containing protein (c-di-GMP phosphodiesterase class II)